jgi:hypothetical protein
MIEKYSCYEYEIIKDDKGWYYIIYDPDYNPCEVSIIRQGEEWLDSEQQAHFAAIGHISLLENGEG